MNASTLQTHNFQLTKLHRCQQWAATKCLNQSFGLWRGSQYPLYWCAFTKYLPPNLLQQPLAMLHICQLSSNIGMTPLINHPARGGITMPCIDMTKYIANFPIPSSTSQSSTFLNWDQQLNISIIISITLLLLVRGDLNMSYCRMWQTDAEHSYYSPIDILARAYTCNYSQGDFFLFIHIQAEQQIPRGATPAFVVLHIPRVNDQFWHW